MKFSIIVPVFNTETYLEECINSVLEQTYTDFELILVDDGSTDNSASICDFYAQNDERIKVYHIINSGVSSARNVGIDNVTGEWLLFLDSDDVLHPKALQVLSENIEIYPLVDIFQFSLTKQQFGDSIIRTDGKSYSELTPQQYCATGFYNVCAAGSVMKVKLITENKLKFDSNLKLAEDQVFVFQVLQSATKCSRLAEVLYYYRDTPFSATKTAKFEYMLQTIRSLQQYKLTMPIAVDQFDNVIISFIYYMVLDKKVSQKEIVDLLKEVNVKSVYRSSRGVKLFFYLSKISKRLAVIILRVLKKIG